MTINNVSFPNIGWSFSLKEVAFTVFGKQIYWYALILTAGMILAVAYVVWRASKEGISSDAVFDFAIAAIILALIGARLYYVLTKLDEFRSFGDVFAIWNGGLGFYGGLIGGAVAVFAVAKIKKMSFLKMYDVCAPALFIGQILGRWGNFVNGEAYGSNTVYEFLGKTFSVSGASKQPWAMHIESFRDGELVSKVECQPTFLYESLWNLAGFVIINLLYKKKKFDGQMIFFYLAWYGFGRMFIEGMRTDSLYVGPFKISQLLGLIFFVGGTVMFFVGGKFLKLNEVPESVRPKQKKNKAAPESGESENGNSDGNDN